MLGKKKIILFQNLINRILFRDTICLAKLHNRSLGAKRMGHKRKKGENKGKLICSLKESEKKMVPFQEQLEMVAVRAEDIKECGRQKHVVGWGDRIGKGWKKKQSP